MSACWRSRVCRSHVRWPKIARYEKFMPRPNMSITNGRSRTALLLVDAQQSFEHAPYWSTVDAPRFYERTQALIDGAQSRGIPLLQIFHVEDSGPFSVASGHVKSLSALSIAPQAVFQKPRHSAFVGSALPVWLA